MAVFTICDTICRLSRLHNHALAIRNASSGPALFVNGGSRIEIVGRLMKRVAAMTLLFIALVLVIIASVQVQV